MKKNLYGCMPLLALLLMLLQGCGESKFEVKGEIEGADDVKIEVEKSNFRGQWQAIDSTRTSPSGKFSIKLPSPAAPEIYRLNIGGKYVYFPIDSIETVNVGGAMATLDREYTLSGTEQAGRFAEFEKSLNSAVASGADMEAFKRNVFEKYIREGKGNLLSYYVLTKTVGDKLLFDPANHSDLRYYAAVATAFREYNPADPRADYLEQTALQALRGRNAAQGKSRQLEATQIDVVEISLPDVNGKVRKLSEEVGKGKKTVVVFSLMNHPDAPAINKALYDLRASKGIDIYQVSLDSDIAAWRDAARNLPWTNVIDTEGSHSSTALSYNVSEIPVFFIYDASGQLKDRAESIDELSGKL